jgi:hypothetical protein
MYRGKQARLRTCWLLLLVFVFATLAPMSGAWGGPHSAVRTIWLELCSPTAHKPLSVELKTKSAKDETGHSEAGGGGHCLLCLHPSTPPRTELPHVERHAPAISLVVVPDLPSPPGAVVWRVSFPRAPPLST